MGDGYWNMPQQQPHIPSPSILKRPRSDYDYSPSGLSSVQNSHSYPAWDDDAEPLVVKDSKSIASAYDRYLQSSQQASLKSGEAGRVGYSGTADGGILHRPDPLMMGQRFDLSPNALESGFSGALPVDAMRRSGGPETTTPLPPDASSTLYIEGLPPNTTRREVAHIFRPFVGYKEVRLVTKESKHQGGPALLLCFVDFTDAACAATAMGVLQGYRMDEDDLHSAYLRLQFSRNPGPRSGSRTRR